jgi:hypothetical protein
MRRSVQVMEVLIGKLADTWAPQIADQYLLDNVLAAEGIARSIMREEIGAACFNAHAHGHPPRAHEVLPARLRRGVYGRPALTVDGSTGGEDREVVLLGAILTPIHSAVALRPCLTAPDMALHCMCSPSQSHPPSLQCTSFVSWTTEEVLQWRNRCIICTSLVGFASFDRSRA